MEQTCVIQRLERPGLTFLKVSGSIDETFSATQLIDELKGDAIFHLGRVQRFSSFGVREWVNMMRQAKQRLRQCMLVECSPAVVNQLNMVANFSGGAYVKSIQLPYLCTACHTERLVTVDMDTGGAKLIEGEVPKVTCPKCNADMGFDDLPESYFGFMRDVPAPQPGSALAEFIAKFESAAPELNAGGREPPSSAPAAATAESPRPAPSPTTAPAQPVRASAAAPAAPAAADRKLRWAIPAGAAALLVALVALKLLPSKPPPEPASPAPVSVQEPAAPKPVMPANAPALRPATAEELVEFNGLLTREHFDAAEKWLTDRAHQLSADSRNQLASMLADEEKSAVARHLERAQALAADGDLHAALAELRSPAVAVKPNEQTDYLKVVYLRRTNDCGAAVTAATEFISRHPDSTRVERVASIRRGCLNPRRRGR